jgi:nanoRNase/pAp phosphatase (c-di-AMP/oligoRNAs hydrolase)
MLLYPFCIYSLPKLDLRLQSSESRWWLISAYNSTTFEQGIPLKNDERITYAILGSGSVGFLVAKELTQRGRMFTIIEKNAKRVETLRDQNFDAHVGDITKEEVITELLTPDLEIVMILSSDVNANTKALSVIKERKPDVFVIVRAADPLSKDKLEELGADAVVYPSALIANATLHDLQKAESQRSANRLHGILKSIKKLGILVHDNPDPDSIASALALAQIAASVDTEAAIIYHGEISRQENRAFVNLLDIDLVHVDEVDPNEYDMLALVDSATPGANNPLTSLDKVGIIIDHHGIPEQSVLYTDIRDVGSTATILTNYLDELDIDIDKRLATALLYGIRIDTQDYKVHVTPADLGAAMKLMQLSDRDILNQIESPTMSMETLDIIGEAIHNKHITGSYLISCVGFMHNVDALAQAADYVLNLEGVTAVAVFGLNEEKIHISARSKDIRVNIGAVMSEAFGDIGSAGGHSNAAAAQIPLGVFTGVKDRTTLLQLVEEVVTRRIYSKIGVERDE